MSFSDYFENTILDAIFRSGDYTIYVGLSTADPGDDGANLAEPSGNGYTRVLTSTTDWAAASGGETLNAEAISFPAAEGSWGTITHFTLFDALTGGNLLASGVLTASKEIGLDQIARFPAGDISITLD